MLLPEGKVSASNPASTPELDPESDPALLKTDAGIGGGGISII